MSVDPRLCPGIAKCSPYCGRTDYASRPGFQAACLSCPVGLLCLGEQPGIIYQCMECLGIFFLLAPGSGLLVAPELYGVKLDEVAPCPLACRLSWHACSQHTGYTSLTTEDT